MDSADKIPAVGSGGQDNENSNRQHEDSRSKRTNAQRFELHPNNNAAQRARILARLRRGPATTIELRREEDVLMPAARIFELRHEFGYDIPLVWVEALTECGRRHRVGLYTLRPVSMPKGAQA